MKEPNSSACLTAICFLAYDAYTEIGNGIMDIQKIIDEGNRVGCPGIMIEQDRSADGAGERKNQHREPEEV